MGRSRRQIDLLGALNPEVPATVRGLADEGYSADRISLELHKRFGLEIGRGPIYEWLRAQAPAPAGDAGDAA